MGFETIGGSQNVYASGAIKHIPHNVAIANIAATVTKPWQVTRDADKRMNRNESLKNAGGSFA